MNSADKLVYSKAANASRQAGYLPGARVGQAFQPASSQDFPVLCPWAGDWKVAQTGRLESLPYLPKWRR